MLHKHTGRKLEETCEDKSNIIRSHFQNSKARHCKLDKIMAEAIITKLECWILKAVAIFALK